MLTRGREVELRQGMTLDVVFDRACRWNNIEDMRVLVSAIFAASCAFASTPWVRRRAAGCGRPVDPAGVTISTGGKVWCKLWFAKSVATGRKSQEDSVSLPTVAHGAFLGVANFPAAAKDRRGNPIKAGVYFMRYSFYPADGNHIGAARSATSSSSSPPPRTSLRPSGSITRP